MQKKFYLVGLSGILLSTSVAFANSIEDENPCPPVKIFMAHTQFNTADKLHSDWRVIDTTTYQHKGYVWHSGIMIFDFSSEINSEEQAIKKAQNYLSKTHLDAPMFFRTCVYAKTDQYVIYADTGEMDGYE